MASGMAELNQTMLFVYSLVGLRPENYPVGLDKDFLNAYILEHYGGHTSEELRLAFTMAIQHKLDVPANDVKPYENFTVAYFSLIMEAYREWAKATINLIPKIEYKRPSPPKWVIDCEFACYLQTTINKLPIKI